MPTPISTIVTLARLRLVELTASYWSDDELVQIAIAGVRDLWRDVVDLKQEHYLTVNNTDVFLGANSRQLSGVPTDVHKVYMIEARDLTNTSNTRGLIFTPLDYNHITFQSARASSAIDPLCGTIYYAITGQGAPVNAPVIYCSPSITSAIYVNFMYVPTLGQLTSTSIVPIPGEADNALIAWVVAFARAKESDDRAPDPNWLSVYATEKAHLLQSLGLRQYQEPSYVAAMFEQYWG